MKQQNKTTSKKKTTVKFFIVVLISALLGAMVGFGTGIFHEGLASLTEALSHTLLVTSPWVLLLFSCAFPLTSWCFLRKGKKEAATLSEEDEAALERVERLLGLSLSICGAGFILILTWFGIMNISMKQKLTHGGLILLFTLVMLLSVLLMSFLQRKAVEETKRLNPEKQGDALDINFQKQWLGSMDEQEKLSAYRAGFKAFRCFQLMAVILHLVTLVSIFFADTGILPFLLIGTLWLVPNLVYTREALKQNPLL